MALQSVNVEAGFTQAEIVKALDMSRELESATVTMSSMPSKYNALPTFPAAHNGPFFNVPVFPFPEESEAVVPTPSSNFQCATRAAGLKVGAATEVELKERKHRIEDAVRNAKAAIEEGLLPGGGVALANASVSALDKLDLTGDEATGANIVRVALTAPLRQIATNAGLEGAVVAEKVASLPAGHGLNAETGEYVDMIKAGIVEPAKVTRSALQNAASIAALFLTTEVLIAERPAD